MLQILMFIVNTTDKFILGLDDLHAYNMVVNF
jgi:hypothetical protein